MIKSKKFLALMLSLSLVSTNILPAFAAEDTTSSVVEMESESIIASRELGSDLEIVTESESESESETESESELTKNKKKQKKENLETELTTEAASETLLPPADTSVEVSDVVPEQETLPVNADNVSEYDLGQDNVSDIPPVVDDGITIEEEIPSVDAVPETEEIAIDDFADVDEPLELAAGYTISVSSRKSASSVKVGRTCIVHLHLEVRDAETGNVAENYVQVNAVTSTSSDGISISDQYDVLYADVKDNPGTSCSAVTPMEDEKNVIDEDYFVTGLSEGSHSLDVAYTVTATGTTYHYNIPIVVSGTDIHTHTFGNYSHNETQHWQVCTDQNCDVYDILDRGYVIDVNDYFEKEDHTFENGVCSVCGYDSEHIHVMTEHPRVESTMFEEGNILYYTCNDCGKYFSDEDGITEISEEDTVIPMKEYYEIDGSLTATDTSIGEGDSIDLLGEVHARDVNSDTSVPMRVTVSVNQAGLYLTKDSNDTYDSVKDEQADTISSIYANTSTNTVAPSGTYYTAITPNSVTHSLKAIAIAPGTYTVSLTATSGGTVYTVGTKTIVVDDSEDDYGTLTIHSVDENSEPYGDCDFTVTKPDNTTVSVTTDEDGTYAFGDVLTGNYTITPTNVPTYIKVSPTSKTVAVAEGADASQTFTYTQKTGTVIVVATTDCSANTGEGAVYSISGTSTNGQEYSQTVEFGKNTDGGDEENRAVFLRVPIGTYHFEDTIDGSGGNITVKDGVSLTVTTAYTHSVLVRHREKSPTCTEAGNTEYYQCRDCEKCFSDADGENEITLASTVISALGHDYGNWTVVTPATEITEGLERRVCSRNASHVENRIIPVLQHTHTLTKESAVSATCTSSGNIEYYVCSGCGRYFSDENGENEIYDEDVFIDPLGHQMSHTNSSSATCTSTGNIEYWTCGRCHKLFSDADGEHEIMEEDTIIDKLSHTLTPTARKEATCTAAGNIAYWTCSECEKLFSDANGEHEVEAEDIVIDKLAHVLTPTARKEATCTEAGNIAYWTCDNCHKLFSDANGENEINENDTVIDATNHTLTPTARKEATCTEAGNIAYWTCSKCQKHFSDVNGTTEVEDKDIAISALGHDYGEWQTVTPATETTEGLERRVCSRNSSHIEERPIPTLQHVHDMVMMPGISATCLVDGSKPYFYCEGCGGKFADYEGEEEISDEDIVIKAPGSHDPYLEDREPGDPYITKCRRCGQFLEGKSFSRIEEEVKPTCTEPGYTITNTNDLITREDFAALGHDWGAWTTVTEPTINSKGLERRVCSRDETHIEERDIPQLASVSRTYNIIWDDDNDSSQTRPDSLTVNLMKDDETIDSADISADTEWSCTFEGLDTNTGLTVSVPNIPRNYRCSDTASSVDSDGNVTESATYSLIQDTDKVYRQYKIIWDDDYDSAGQRPESLTINLMNGDEVIDSAVLSNDNNWVYKFENLDTNDGLSVELVGTIPSGYEEGGVLSNTDDNGNVEDRKTFVYSPSGTTPTTVTMSFRVKWEDNDDSAGKRPESLTLNLLNGNNVSDSATLSNDNNWYHAFTGLDGSVNWDMRLAGDIPSEYMPAGAASSMDEDGNVHKSETYAFQSNEGTVTRGFQIEWDDNDNAAGYRPTSLTLNLMKGNQVIDSCVLSDSNNWSHTFENLETNTGVSIDIVEEIPDVYISTASSSSIDANGNVSARETYSLNLMPINNDNSETYKVEWEDNNNASETRPDSLTVNLLKDGEVVDSAVISEDNDWTCTFDNLDPNSEYTTELAEDVPEGYELSVENGVSTLSLKTNENQGNQGEQGGNQGEQGGNQGEQGGNQGEQGGNQGEQGGNQGEQGGNQGEQGGNQGEQGGNQGEQGGNQGEQGGNQGEQGGNQGEQGGNQGEQGGNQGEVENQTDTVTYELTWNDDEDAEKKRPTSLTVNLLKDGAVVDSAVISDANDWKCTFNVVGTEDEYTTELASIPDDYELEMVDGYATLSLKENGSGGQNGNGSNGNNSNGNNSNGSNNSNQGNNGSTNNNGTNNSSTTGQNSSSNSSNTKETEKDDDESKVKYSFVEGGNSRWEKGSTTPLKFVIKRNKKDSKTFGNFSGVTLDGNEINSNNYTAEAGSLILTIKPDFLNSLQTGEHTLRVYFKDGDISTTVTVVDGQSSANNGTNNQNAANEGKGELKVQTGDNFNPVILIVLVAVILGLFGAGFYSLTLKRNKNNS